MLQLYQDCFFNTLKCRSYASHFWQRKLQEEDLWGEEGGLRVQTRDFHITTRKTENARLFASPGPANMSKFLEFTCMRSLNETMHRVKRFLHQIFKHHQGHSMKSAFTPFLCICYPRHRIKWLPISPISPHPLSSINRLYESTIPLQCLETSLDIVLCF